MFVRTACRSAGLAIVAAAIPVALLGGPVLAQTASSQDAAESDAPAQLSALLACRDIGDKSDRLECFDRAAQQVANVRDSGDLLVADRDTVEAEREARFGATSNVDLWLGDNQLAEKTYRLTAVQLNPTRLYTFTMDDGAVWQQLESASMRPPKAGDEVTIKAGIMGSFRARINGGRPLRVKRIR
ncbi:MAG: hypothetical protein RQ806_05240 [Erythrobacter sp.]|nr:hypothetical protein [Erythrobacter sp.]